MGWLPAGHVFIKAGCSRESSPHLGQIESCGQIGSEGFSCDSDSALGES